MGLRIDVDKDGLTGMMQMSISDDLGGYRLAGPTYNGSGRNVFSARINEHAAAEIRKYLDKHFPVTGSEVE